MDTPMKWPALLLIGLGLITPAGAQDKGASVEFLPIPETMPEVLFRPQPLAGSMLQPLRESEEAAGEGPTAQDTAAEGPGGSSEAEITVEAPAFTGPPPPSAEPTTGALAPAPETPATSDLAPAAVPPAETSVAPLFETATPAPAEQTAPSEEGTIIHVIVENVASAAGVVNVAVCDTALSHEGCPYDTSIPASEGFVEAVFKGIPPGKYAVVGYHDVNGNDEFDKFLGMPREPYALSSKAAEELVPTFDDAVMNIGQGENVVIIRLKTLGGG
jgi:uncharacterized protein (DUF2141 family)